MNSGGTGCEYVEPAGTSWKGEQRKRASGELLVERRGCWWSTMVEKLRLPGAAVGN